MNWAYLHHAIGAMRDEEEFQDVVLLRPDGTVVQLRALIRSGDGQWTLVETADAITDDQLRALFAEHCACRPLDTARISHSHDCNTLYTDTCREALHGTDRAAARARCAEILRQRLL